jgi:hypothetical protein
MSTSIFATGCSSSISCSMVTPSFVMVMFPVLSTSILSIPFGPSVVFTVSAMILAARILFLLASFPVVLLFSPVMCSLFMLFFVFCFYLRIVVFL